MKIILTTLNARYSHTSLALRYLYANLKELKDISEIQEYTINDNIQEIAEKILKNNPSIVGIGVYIWNSIAVSKLIQILRKISPKLKIILGGPEVSYKPYRVDFDAADYYIQGEGEISFYNLCRDITNGITHENTTINEVIPSIDQIMMPYKYYSDHDINNRVLYVEASRGCPFNCEFCLSSVNNRVRDFDIDIILREFQTLWDRGARIFKFIDRTFNININKISKILNFFLNKKEKYMVHFEVIPEHFPEKLKSLIEKFPTGQLQLEVGIQTLNEDVANRINRKMNFEKIKENLYYLENSTNAHLHVDLIIGLPGESLDSFGENLNKLASLTNCEIQLGVLKKLSGTKIDRHDIKYGMIYNNEPPYDILQNDLISFLEMQEMKRFARYWDITFNSGNFKTTLQMFWPDNNVYRGFKEFSLWVYNRSETTHQISLNRLSEYIFEYLVSIKDFKEYEVANSLVLDTTRAGGRKVPSFLRKHATIEIPKFTKKESSLGRRQNQHLE